MSETTTVDGVKKTRTRKTATSEEGTSKPKTKAKTTAKSTAKATSKSADKPKATTNKTTRATKGTEADGKKAESAKKVASTRTRKKVEEQESTNAGNVGVPQPESQINDEDFIPPADGAPVYEGDIKDFKFEKSKGKRVNQIVVERIVTAIQEGLILPWHKPFLSEMINHVNERPYSGINRWLLMGGSGEFITKKQLERLNEKRGTSFQLPEGRHQEYMVIFYSPSVQKITESKAKEFQSKGRDSMLVKKGDQWYRKSFLLRYYNVYDIADIKPDKDGNKLEPKMGKTVHIAHSDADAIVNGYCEAEGIQIRPSTIAAYSPQGDYLMTPPPTHYTNSEFYYRVMFHEMVHSTGHSKRLNRKSLIDYHSGGKNRHREELIAEMGALFLATEAGFSHEGFETNNSLTYIAGWCSWMLDNPDELLMGVAQSEKAVQYILKKSGALPEDVAEPENDGLDLKDEEMEVVSIG